MTLYHNNARMHNQFFSLYFNLKLYLNFNLELYLTNLEFPCRCIKNLELHLNFNLKLHLTNLRFLFGYPAEAGACLSWWCLPTALRARDPPGRGRTQANG